MYVRPVCAFLFFSAIAVPAAAMGGLQQPLASQEQNRFVDEIMPPLSTMPAATEVFDSASIQDNAVLLSAAAAGAAKVPAEFMRYLSSLATATYQSRQIDAKVINPLAFNEMKRYLFNRYNGVTVLRTLQQDGRLFDCILSSQQPGLRDGSAVAAPPALADPQGGSATGTAIASDKGQRCDAGSVPLERLDIAEMVKHPDLVAFLHRQKVPMPSSPATPRPPAVSANGHYYSSIFADTAGRPVTGAGALLNVWDPELTANDFQSISQIWLGGKSNQGLRQTLEVGWEEQPAGWGSKPIVFVYSTQDGYRTGCHNLDCSSFVQVSSTNILGAVPPGGFSVFGGKQTTLAVEYQRNADGNWWARLNGEWIGYYKAGLFSGDLANGSNAIAFTAGGETSARDHNPSTVMGSGQFAAAGYQKAAFQANHFYRDAGLNTYPVQNLANLSLGPPQCYTMAIAGYTHAGYLGAATNAVPAPEMKTGGFYFGGPGCR